MFLVVVVDDDVESADDLAILSSIEIIWCLGKNCMAVGTGHIIVDFQQQQQAERPADKRTMLWRVPTID
jgi:hypothetical protein